MNTSKHLLYIGHLWPEPASSAAGYRTLAILEAALAAGWQVSFASAAEKTPWSLDLESSSVNCISIQINASSFDQFIQDCNPDFVLFDRFMTEEQFAWRVEKHSPRSIRILDSIDLHFLRRARQKALNNNTRLDLLSEDAKREIAAIYRCDLSLIISDYEMQLLNDTFGIDNSQLFYSPFMLDVTAETTSPSFTERQHFIMIGNFIHAPNWDAVRWCYDKIWPEIHAALPAAELHVYGAYTPDKAKQLHQPKKGFHIMGRAEKLPELFASHRVNLVPLRYGAGIKGKVADGFLSGTPNVTTSIGAEGMSGGLPWGGYIADSETDFIKQAIHLYQNPMDWQQCQKQGFDIIQQVHDKTVNQNLFIKRLVELEKNIQKQRKNNFIGAMLRHHFHRSTEFMARWIEQKNKA